jgi:hypothetical protein
LIGQAYIELYKNGKLYERVEQHNTVTDAIENRIALDVARGTYGLLYEEDAKSDESIPLPTRGLGGVWLFDHALSGYIHFPSNEAHMVGYAGQSVNTSDPFAGSINTLESGALEEKNGYKNTWDFSTSQANGTIASICLTHDRAGRSPLNQATAGWGSTFLHYKYRDLYYDESTGYAYGLRMGDDSDKGLYKYRRPGRYIKTLSPYFGSGEKVLDLSHPDMRSRIFYDYMGDIVGMRGISDKSIQLDIINVSTWTKTTKTITVGVSDKLYAATMCVCRGYIYVCSQSDTTKMYKVDMESPSIVTTIQMSSGNPSSPFFFPMPMGGVMNSEGRIIYPDGTYQKLTGNSTNLGVLYGNGYVSDELWCSTGGEPQRALGYIGTVCNLDEPIVKTAATSMKLVYTLKDA